MSITMFMSRNAAVVSATLLLGCALPSVADVAAPAAIPRSTNPRLPLLSGEILPTGKRITPEAATQSLFQPLNPGLPNRPEFLADHAVDISISPNGTSLLILTSGYNRNNGADGRRVDEDSLEYVFVYDIRDKTPIQKQVIQVPNTYNGITWHPDGNEFYVSGGIDDNVHVYRQTAGQWSEAAVVALGHESGEGRFIRPLAAGVAVNSSGTRLLVANHENDSISLINLETLTEIAELDLRPGRNDPSQKGQPGGSYPFSIAFKGNEKAYVSSQRDREIVVVDAADDQLGIIRRIPTQGQPNKMALNRSQDRLFVASDNSDTVVIIDTARDRIVEEIPTTAPEALFPAAGQFKGANPNNVALAPDERTLFVTNGGTNSVAVIQLGKKAAPAGARAVPTSRVVGLIPTGWYPNAVAVRPDGEVLYVVNGKSNTGPNPDTCRNTTSIAPGSLNECRAANQYVWQLEKAGFLTLPVPRTAELARLTLQVAYNNQFPLGQFDGRSYTRSEKVMRFLRNRIKHVIYVIKENRTYDQLHGNLEIGNGDPSLAILAPYAPNHNQITRQFVALDNFHDSGEVSGVGWNWTTAARATDFAEKTNPPWYAGRLDSGYDWEGANRNVAVSLPTVAERQALDPEYPNDPDLLAGTADVSAPDSPTGEAGTGYLWDSALRAGLTVRNYGVFVQNINEPVAQPFAQGIKQAVALKQALEPNTDVYFRGYDQRNSDYYLFQEWEREFDGYVRDGNLPNLSFVRLPHDHFGNFRDALFGVDTVEEQMADNDYAVGRLVEKVANSPYASDTLIFIIEDDAQNGPDHVDAHRSIAYIVGPYVKQNALVSTHYTTVSMIRTINDVLGLPPLGLNDGLTPPMADVFDITQNGAWTYQALVPEILYNTELQLPPRDQAVVAKASTPCLNAPKRDANYWAVASRGQNFSVEDKLDEVAFNRALWTGLRGDAVPYPQTRSGRDLRSGREALLAAYRKQLEQECAAQNIAALNR